MLYVSPLPSIATNHTEKSWKTSLFRRRRSLPQIKASFASKRNSRSTSTEEDTLTSRISDPFFDYTINDDCSYSIIDVTPENPTPLLPFGQDQLVVSTTVNSSTVLYTQLHRPKDPEVRDKFELLNVDCAGHKLTVSCVDSRL